MIKLKAFAAKTDQGPYLQTNEDTYDVDLVNELFMVFDGLGGAGVGDKCVSILKENIKSFYTRVSGNPDATMPFYFSHKYLLEGNALLNALHYSHRVLFKENQTTEMGKRGGASAIAGALSENILTLASVGNCLCYLYRKGKMMKVFQPDSLLLLTRDDYNLFHHTAPLSAFGLFEDLHMEIKEVKLSAGDLIIMLTDGAYSRIQEQEIKYMIEKVEIGLAEKMEEIFSLANSRGNWDNQSAVLLQF